MPKVRLFIFLSIFQLFINISIFLYSSLINNTIDLLGLFAQVGSAFIPLISFAPLALSGVTIEVIVFIGIFTGIVSVLQLYLIAEVILAHLPTVNT